MVAVLAAAACPGGGRTRGAGGAGGGGGGDYERGLAAFRAGQPDQAVAAFERSLLSEENEAARYYVTLAEVQRAQCGRARLALAALAKRHPGSNLLAEARAAVLGCREDAVPGRADEPTARAALAEARAAGDAFHVVVWSARLSALGGDAALGAEARAAAAAAVDALPARQLEDVWPLVEPGAFPAPLVAVRRVRLALHRGDLALARELVPAIADPALAEAARAELAAAENLAVVEPRKLGVLLPLSGARAGLGKELKAAIDLAASGAGAGVELIYADTAGDEARAAAEVDRLVAEQHVIGLLGPVGERESSAAAARAAALGVPIALFTPVDGLADARAGVFTLWSSGEDRARLTARAVLELGYEAPAVLAPRDDAGLAQAAAFAAEAAALGHPVVRSGEYDPTGTDLEPDVKAFLGLDPARNQRLREHLARHKKDGWKTFSPDVDFDVLFVPDGHERGALIAAFMTYFNVELRTADDLDSRDLAKKHGGRLPSFVRLVGGAGWNHPNLPLRGGADVEWALIVDVFFAAEPAGEGAASFAERFAARLGRPPSSLAAQAFDAATLLFSAHARAGGTREGLRAALAAARAGGDVLACGPASVDARGELLRGGVLLRVDGGQLTLADPLPPPGQRLEDDGE